MKIADNLQVEEKIKKLKIDNKVRFIMVCIIVPIIIGFGVYLIVLKEPQELGFGFLLSAPFSYVLGYIMPVKINNKKIQELERLILLDCKQDRDYINPLT